MEWKHEENVGVLVDDQSVLGDSVRCGFDVHLAEGCGRGGDCADPGGEAGGVSDPCGCFPFPGHHSRGLACGECGDATEKDGDIRKQNFLRIGSSVSLCMESVAPRTFISLFHWWK